ncbi:MAG TPA: gliding motility protein GldM [Bacteroidales bacterium]|nr:gliding motility protein GldM [Bacteroidales bacterium]
MAGGKQTPRQKLIGLMYLIFLSLMALNVSRQVLDAFPHIDDGIIQTNLNLDQKTETVMQEFIQQEVINPAAVEPFYADAKEVRRLAQEMVAFIQQQRAEMIAAIDGIPVEQADTMNLIDLQNKDNYSNSSRFWVQEHNQDPINIGGQGTRAYELRSRIEAYRNSLLEIATKHGLQDAVTLGLNLDGPYVLPNTGTQISWQQYMFDRVIPVAIATNLTRLTTEVRNAEFDVINTLFGAIGAEDFKFDQIEARVVPRSQIVLAGENYEAEIFVAAIDSRTDPTIIVDGRSIPTEGGVGRLVIPASGTGERTFRGVIRVTNPAGIPQEYPFQSSFMIQRPYLTVSADAMNLFYIGVDNPVSISVPGIPTENLRPSISTGATLVHRGGARYTVRVSPGVREVQITANAIIDGTSRSMGTSTFRVRTVPDPVAQIAGRREGRISREELALARAIIPRLEGFEFDMNFEIASFSMATTVGGDFRTFAGTGNTFTSEMMTVINNATRGQRFIFENITTRPGPDGRVRTLSPLTFTIN